MADILVVTKGDKEGNKNELSEVLFILENAQYRLRSTKAVMFISEIEWMGHRKVENSIRPLQDKQEAILELKYTKNQRKLK